jgi:hypothetical protein
MDRCGISRNDRRNERDGGNLVWNEILQVAKCAVDNDEKSASFGLVYSLRTPADFKGIYEYIFKK